jgi:dipeptidyl aminopeptidase/acylaminoacyl peptidase
MRTIAACLILLWAPAAAQSPITHEKIWLMKRVGAPAPSPDGKWVVFPVIQPSYDPAQQESDLWIVPADGSAPPRRLTFTKGAESGAAWSPDSQRLAFSAQREGDAENQIYILDLAAGGEAVRLTSLSGGAASPKWRPDGKALLFSSLVYPEAGDDAANRKIVEERRARKYSARVYEGFPIRHWDQWLDDRQLRLFVQDAEPGVPARDLLAGTRLIAEPGYGMPFAPTGGQQLDATWTPDGQSIVFAATTRRNTAAYAFYNTHLFQVTASGGEPRQLTGGLDAYSHPAFRPDGRALYCKYSKSTDNPYNLDRLAKFDWPSPGPPAIVTAGFDRAVDKFGFAPDSKTVYLIAEDAGHEKLYAVPSAGGQVREVGRMSLGVYTNLAIPAQAPSTVLVANWESAVNPAEIVRLDAAAGTHTRLSSFNVESAASIDWQALRHFWFTSKRGKRIHSLLALPPAFDESKKYPLLVLLHGGPHSMWRDYFFLRWNYHLLAQPGYVVLMTNYTGSTGFGEKFAQEIQGDPRAPAVPLPRREPGCSRGSELPAAISPTGFRPPPPVISASSATPG